jgi:chromosome segregation protein
MGFAEVSVTFDNSDPENRLDSEFDEVVITRRYYRTGESEYLINRQPKRLRDIYELFMNTGVGREGYSIIGQGKVAEIVSKKSDERRNIFEEAAGISKYRHRKEESERKLKSTQDNLDRVRDILTELENRVVPLEKEAEKARKGLALYEEKKRADVSLWLYDTKKIRVDVDEAEKALKLLKHQLDIADQIISDLEAQSDNLYSRTQSNRALSEKLYDEMRALNDRLHEIDSSIKIAETEFMHSAELIKQCMSRIDDINRSIEALETTKSGYNAKKTEAENDLNEHMDIRLEYLAEIQKLSSGVEKLKNELNEALDEITVEENSLQSINLRISILKASIESGDSRSKEIEKEIAKYESEGEVLKAEADRCEKNAEGFKSKIAEKDKIITECGESVSSKTEEKQALTDELGELKVKRNSSLERADALKRMVEHFEGYAESVKFVMNEYSSGALSGSGKIYGPLSSLIKVDAKYITALETALGASLQNIVVDSEDTAKLAINHLKRANAGRATFYPISAIKSGSETDEIKRAKDFSGYIGRADTLVGSDDKYRSIIEWLLIRTLVFDNIDNAAICAKKLNYKVKIVTLDGQVINAGGAFTGGSAKRDSGILSRISTIDKLRREASEIDEKVKTISAKIEKLDLEISKDRESLRDAEQEKELLLTLSRSQFAALDNANAKYDANCDILSRLRQDLSSISGEATRADEEIISLNADYDANLERIEALKSIRLKRSEEMGVLDEKRDELNSRVHEVDVKIEGVRANIDGIDALIQSVDARIDELCRDKDNQNSRIEELRESRKSIDTKKAEGSLESQKLEEELKALSKRRVEEESDTDEFDKELSKIRLSLKEKTSARQVSYEAVIKQESELMRLEERRDKLGTQLWEDYEITYEDAVALNYPAVTEENREEIAKVQSSCRGKLRALGGYNPGAIEEFAEVKARYDSLTEQYTDLTKSYDELIDVIARLEVEMRSSFITSFEAINKNFGITFKELFGGGTAELLLTEPEDVLTSGIEIKAAPPGKIIKSLSLLSGGEQSFVAIALLFAILKVNPTPFCILDEIEAALDEVNVFRFGEYIKKLSDGTQFILITHRRGTMEVGDRLYGVTMPQRGISEAIELNVSEIEGKQKELLDGVL